MPRITSFSQQTFAGLGLLRPRVEIARFIDGVDFTAVDVFGGSGGDLGFTPPSQAFINFANESIIIGAELEIFDDNTSTWIPITVTGFGDFGQTQPVQGEYIIFNVDIPVNTYDITALRQMR